MVVVLAEDLILLSENYHVMMKLVINLYSVDEYCKTVGFSRGGGGGFGPEFIN